MAADFPYLYPFSKQEAKRRNELRDWRESHKYNVACKEAIEAAIRKGFDGARLRPGCAKSVIEEFGFKRVGFVLSNSLREKPNDCRFSQKNLEWSRRIDVPPHEAHNYAFAVDSPPAVLNGFVNQFHSAYEELGLFGPEHCMGNRHEQDYEGKVLVLSPDSLREGCWKPQDQLWYAHDGFGCSPHAIGRSIRATCLSDGEMARWNRSDFTGVLDEQYLPGWARIKLAELTGQEQAGPAMDGMKM